MKIFKLFVMENWKEIIRELIIDGGYGKSPVIGIYRQIVDNLDSMDSINDPLFFLSKRCDPMIIELVQMDNNPYFRKEISFSKTLLRLILGFGADVNVEDKKGRTSLFYALMYNDGTNLKRGIVNILIENGADLCHIDCNGQTPLLFLCSEMTNHQSYYPSNCMRIVVDENISLLLRKGVNKDAQDSKDKTALDYLKEYDWRNKSVPMAISILKGEKEPVEGEIFDCPRCKLNKSVLGKMEWSDGMIICSDCHTDMVLAPFEAIPGFFSF